MNFATPCRSKWSLFPRALALALAALSCLASSQRASADLITLGSGNSAALFATEPGDGPPVRGLYQWNVDGTNHIAQQWFWYRVGAAGGEAALDTLNQTFITTNDVDGLPGQDQFLVRYRDPAQTFEVSVNYLLTGSMAPQGDSHLGETVTVRNLTDQPLDFHLFQYVDFDVGGDASGDSVVMTGTPINTAVQTDGPFTVAEAVVTPRPSHYEVNQFGGPNNLEDRLDDALPTLLADDPGPLVNLDATWAFQWDTTIDPRGIFILSKDKSIQETIPEPSTIVLASLAGVGLLGRFAVRRFRRASRD